MDEDNTETTAERQDDDRFRGLEDVLKTAADLAEQLRKTTVSAGRVGEREVAMLIGIGEEIRDRGINPEILKRSREAEVLGGLRKSTHRLVDLGFDVVGAGLQLGTDAINTFLMTPRSDKAIET